jgi:hypothetical protein
MYLHQPVAFKWIPTYIDIKSISVYVWIAMGVQHFLVLQALLQNTTLIVQQQYQAKEVSICFSNGIRGDSWSDNWNKMNQETSFNTSRYTASIPESAVEYKLRVVLQNGSIIDSAWKTLLLQSSSIHFTRCSEDISTILNLTIFIAIYIIVSFIFMILLYCIKCCQ